jgi:hypothetical protein
MKIKQSLPTILAAAVFLAQVALPPVPFLVLVEVLPVPSLEQVGVLLVPLLEQVGVLLVGSLVQGLLQEALAHQEMREPPVIQASLVMQGLSALRVLPVLMPPAATEHSRATSASFPRPRSQLKPISTKMGRKSPALRVARGHFPWMSTEKARAPYPRAVTLGEEGDQDHPDNLGPNNQASLNRVALT